MNPSLKGKFFLMSASFFWGCSYFLSKISYNYTSVMLMISLRFLIGSIFVAVFFLKDLKKINLSILKKGSVLGFFLFLAVTLSSYGVKYTSATNAGFLSCLNIIFISFIHFFIFKKKLKTKEIIGTILTFIGVCLLTITDELKIYVGDILCIFSTIAFSVVIILGDKFSKKENPILISLVQLFLVGILSTIYVSFAENFYFPKDKEGIFVILFLSFLCTGYCYVAQLYGQKNVNTVEATLILSLEPVFSAIFSFLFLNEILLFRSYIGAILMFVGILIGGVF